MPESVTDRPTKSHEYLFLLTKSPRYFFDQEAVREKAEWARWGDQTNGKHAGSGSAASWIPDRTKGELQGGRQRRQYDAENFKTTDERNTRFQGPSPADGGRNVRSVWEIATQPYPEAHFATFPEELPRRAIAAGCPLEVCRTCGKPRERIVDVSYTPMTGSMGTGRMRNADPRDSRNGEGPMPKAAKDVQTLGWSDCGHNDYRPGVVLDPFAGAGTTLLVARKLGLHSIGIELNPDYCRLIADRTRQLSLLAEGAA